MRTAYVEAVATAPGHQRKGLATAVLQRLVDVVAADPSWQLAALSPSDAAFYERLGWELWRARWPSAATATSSRARTTSR